MPWLACGVTTHTHGAFTGRPGMSWDVLQVPTEAKLRAVAQPRLLEIYEGGEIVSKAAYASAFAVNDGRKIGKMVVQ
jgi:hypothetical protein